MVLVDNFSKSVLLGALPDRTSKTLATWFMREVIGIFGVPHIVKLDNGREF